MPADARASAAEAERDRLRAALTPSAETKAAHIGEFHFYADLGVDEHGEEATARVMVPWITVKEIMAAIRRHAEGGGNG